MCTQVYQVLHSPPFNLNEDVQTYSLLAMSFLPRGLSVDPVQSLGEASQNHRTIKVGKDQQIPTSNPNPPYHAHWPHLSVPHLHGSGTPPGMVTVTPWAAVPLHYCSSWEETFPNIQPEYPLVQLKALTSCPIDYLLSCCHLFVRRRTCMGRHRITSSKELFPSSELLWHGFWISKAWNLHRYHLLTTTMWLNRNFLI